MAISEARAWVEIDLGALRANYATVRRRVPPGTRIVPMVKADGYGLGAERVVRALDALDPWGYGVATVAEGKRLRLQQVKRPLLVVAPVDPGDLAAAAAARLTPSLSSMEAVDAWVAAASEAGGDSPLDFHVEVDTGMGRSGFDWRDAREWGAAVADRIAPSVRWSGCFTHFHSADARDPAPSREQWERLQETLVQLPVPREHLMVHACNSAAALRWPEYAADAVRPGIFLYGGRAAQEGVAARPKPVVSVRSRLALVREKRPGSTAGYGATHTASAAERWGTLTIGYGDGVSRRLGNRGEVLVRGRRAPIIGRISMDLTTIRVDDPEVPVGEVATLIGRDGNEEITVDEVAGHAGTIGYEVLTGLGSRLPRIERGG